MWALNREDRSDSDITLGIDHYSVQGALALSLAVLPLLAAWREDVRPFVPVCASVAAFYLGLVSLAWPSSPGGLGRAWSVAAMTWALVLLAVTLARFPRQAQRAGVTRSPALAPFRLEEGGWTAGTRRRLAQSKVASKTA